MAEFGRRLMGRMRHCTPLIESLWQDLRAYAILQLLSNLMSTVPRLLLSFALGLAGFAVSAGARNAGLTDGVADAQTRWMLVTAPGFKEALAPLIQERRAEGFQVSVVDTMNLLTRDQVWQGDGQPLQAYIERCFQQSKTPMFLLLAGVMKAPDASAAEQTVVPGLAGAIGRMKGKPSDLGYSLPDSNGMPRVAAGRFPARTMEEMQSMVQKTLALEHDRQPGTWRNRLVLLEGNPGGGTLAEMFVEQATTPRLRRLHPAFNVQVMADMGVSAFYLPTSDLHGAALKYLQEGELFSFYLGHSDPSGLWSGNSYFMSRDDWTRLRIPHGGGVFFTCGCHACQWGSAKDEGYGLAATRNPAGPAAVIGASGESYSAPGLLAIDGFLRRCSEPPFSVRLADYWLAVQAGLAQGPIDAGTFALYDQFDGSGGKVPLEVQRREHLEMWMLLGDPGLHLPLVPLDISFDPVTSVATGKRITVQGTLPDCLKGAPVSVTLERPPGSRPRDLEKLPQASPETALARETAARNNHRKANNVVLAGTEVKSNGRRFECSIQPPDSLPWSNVVVRAYAAKAGDSALGVALLPVSH
jgi:hypothetical protein